VPLPFDYAYCGLYLGQGWRFLAGHWYLTLFYAVPWLILLPMGLWLARQPEPHALKGSDRA